MVNVIEKVNNCYGCTACVNACPKKAIFMEKNEKGFLYSKIDKSRCINCGICQKVCPAINRELPNSKIKKLYAVKLKDENLRLESRSGGVFVALSDVILKNDGVIYGSTLDEKMKVKHIRCTTAKQRDKCKKSKYVQSELNNIYQLVMEDLKDEKNVLFSGTPCQVSGLLNFLTIKKTDLSKLITIDIVCHGTPSPKLFSDYINYLEVKNNSKISNFNFRDKKYGWGGHYETIKFENSTEITESIYRELFYSHCALRESCYNCGFTSTERVSDITIADCWGIDNINKEFNDDKGVSLTIINTQKGEIIFNDIFDKVNMIEVELENVLQPNMQHPTLSPKNKEKFWKDYNEKGFDYIVKKYGKEKKHIIQNFKNIVKRIIKKIIKILSL